MKVILFYADSSSTVDILVKLWLSAEFHLQSKRPITLAIHSVVGLLLGTGYITHPTEPLILQIGGLYTKFHLLILKGLASSTCSHSVLSFWGDWRFGLRLSLVLSQFCQPSSVLSAFSTSSSFSLTVLLFITRSLSLLSTQPSAMF